MNRTVALLIAGVIVMVAAIVYALVAGSFMAEAAVLFPSPWFQLTLVDLYLGFILFACWIFAREPKRGVAVGWLIALCLLGNLAACMYAALAVIKARGDRRAFWLGAN